MKKGKIEQVNEIICAYLEDGQVHTHDELKSVILRKAPSLLITESIINRAFSRLAKGDPHYLIVAEGKYKYDPDVLDFPDLLSLKNILEQLKDISLAIKTDEKKLWPFGFDLCEVQFMEHKNYHHLRKDIDSLIRKYR